MPILSFAFADAFGLLFLIGFATCRVCNLFEKDVDLCCSFTAEFYRPKKLLACGLHPIALKCLLLSVDLPVESNAISINKAMYFSASYDFVSSSGALPSWFVSLHLYKNIDLLWFC